MGDTLGSGAKEGYTYVANMENFEVGSKLLGEVMCHIKVQWGGGGGIKIWENMLTQLLNVSVKTAAQPQLAN